MLKVKVIFSRRFTRLTDTTLFCVDKGKREDSQSKSVVRRNLNLT